MKTRTLLAVVLALVFYAVTDILIWQRIFEANELWQYADAYHTGWFVTLTGYICLGVVLLWGRWKAVAFYVLALAVTAFSGLEDVLYYALDAKAMPAALPWLGGNPMIFGVSRGLVLFSALFWVTALAGLYWNLFLRPQSFRDWTGHVLVINGRAMGKITRAREDTITIDGRFPSERRA